jgi:hypothetical protein
MARSLQAFFKDIRRKPTTQSQGLDKPLRQKGPIRMSGTNEATLISDGQSDELGEPIGRQGNDHITPDNPRNYFVVGDSNGDRLQDFANSHLSEGPNPGRISRQWNKRIGGGTGRGSTGNPAGVDYLVLGVSGVNNQEIGGIGDGKYIAHLTIPRGSMMARAHTRTIDDAASIPAVYVSDPTRH